MLGVAGELVLCSVAAPPDDVLRDDTGRVIAYVDQQEEARQADAQRYLGGVVASLRRRLPGLHVSTDVRLGAAAAGIVATAVERGADLVVMASHGRTGLARAVLGSVAGEVLRTGTTPVLLVRPQPTPAQAVAASPRTQPVATGT
jgi:nucleotide-binding universal stress UspA family protein